MTIVASLSRLLLARSRTPGVRRNVAGEVNAKVHFVVAAGILLALVACGSQPGHAASRSPSTRPVPASTAPSPSPASPAPDVGAQPESPAQPPNPLVVVRSPNGMVGAATADGTFAWSFNPRALGIGTPELVTGGPHLLAYGNGQVAVIDRGGRVIGHGPFPKQDPGGSELLPEPTGTRWAWTTLDTMPADGASSATPQVSSLWVAGVGQPPRKVRTWTGGYEVRGEQWSDAGIVVVKLTSMCGFDPHSSVLVDPTSGAETALFGAGRWPLDVAAGLYVAMGVDSTSLYVEGAAQVAKAYPLPIHRARVDPAGGLVFVSTFGELGCGGQPKAATSIIAVPSGTQTTIEGFFADTWLDDTHLLGRSLVTRSIDDFNWSSHVQVADLSGRTSDVALGTLVGVLRP